MLGNFHAAVLVSLLAATIFLCGRHGERPTWRKSALGIGVGIFTMLVTISFSLHSCDNGEPVMQWFVPGVCMIATLMLVGPRWIRISMASLLTVVMVSLSWSYVNAVHTAEYISTQEPRWHPGASHGHRLWHSPLTGLYGRDPGPTF